MMVMGIGLLAYLFVLRFVYHDPDTQDPFVFSTLVALALIVLGVGSIPALVKYYEEEEIRTCQHSDAQERV
jgi:hypothetical protein